MFNPITKLPSRVIYTFASMALITGVTAAPKAETHAKRPNIVLIMADDMGYSDTQPFGGEIRTPNLEHLAEGGKKFLQFYNTARCCTTRASLITGLYSHQAGIGHLIYKTPYIGYNDFLTSDCVTIAEALHATGYGTYMSGKWHMAPRSYDPIKDIEHWPTRRGFDQFYGTIAGSGSFYDPSTLCRNEAFVSPYADPDYKPEHFYYTDAISDNAVKFIGDHEKRSPEKPFFLYVAYTAAHWPLQAPADEIAKYDGKYDAGYKATHDARIERLKKLNLIPNVGDTADVVGDWSQVKDKKIESALMETYAAMVTRMDEGVGKIMGELKSTGQLDNTLVIYLQDNGGCAEDPYRKKREPREPIAPMKATEIQTDSQPKFTREGKPVRTGHDIMPGSPEALTAYRENWANVSNSPFRKYKHFVHEGGISTPLIAYWPSAIHPTSATQIVRTPAHLIDIMATCIDVANAKYPAERDGVKIQPMEGVTLLPALTDSGKIHREQPIFFEHEGNRAVRDGKWKLVALSDSPWELYDMSVDRGEMNDLAKAHPDIVKRMNDQWYAWAETSRVLPLGGWMARHGEPDPPVDHPSITLSQNEILPREKSPILTDHGVKISARIIDGPVKGVIVAQGASRDGYSLYAKNGKIIFAARRCGTLHQVETKMPLPKTPFDVTVEYAKRGEARLTVGDESVTANFYGPLLLMPSQGASAGLDSETPVAKYPKEFKFKGKLGKTHVSTTSEIHLANAQ